MNSDEVSAGRGSSRSPARVGNLLLVAASFLLAVFSLFEGLGRVPLMNPDEGRNASVAREMLAAHEWLVPRYNGAVYLDKPAFFFDASALAMRLFGVSAGAARLPSALSAAALLLAVFLFCRRERGTRMASLAVVIVATLPLYAIFARLVIFDMLLASFVSLAIFAGYVAERTDGGSRRAWYVLGALSAGAATLVKGPVGFVLPLLVLLVFNPLDGRRGAWKRMLSPLNLLVFNAVVLPWLLGLSYACPDFPRYGLIEETLHRFTTGQFRRRASIFFFIPVIAGGFLSWNLLLPEGGWLAWRSRRNWSSIVRLCIVWSIALVCFFSIPRSKMPAYILTVSVSVGILVAAVFDAAWRNPASRSARIVIRAIRALGILSFASAAIVVLGLLVPALPHRNLEAILDKSAPLRPLFMAAAAGLFSISALSCLAQRKTNIPVAFGLFVAFQLVLRTVALASLTVLGESRSSRPLASALSVLPPDTEVAVFGTFSPGLPFYLGRAVTLVSSDGKELRSNYLLFSIRNTGRWPSTVLPTSQLYKWLARRRHPVMLVARHGNREFIEGLASRLGGKVVAPAPGYCGVLIPVGKEH